MCSTCVDRLFTSGPASCPVVACGKTLRKKGFHKAFFGDLKVERECDIRRRVGEVFNRLEDEFEGLQDWNDYLEFVEGLIFDLVEGTTKEKAKAEDTLRAHRAANVKEIEENKRAGLEAQDVEKQREKQEKEATRQRRWQSSENRKRRRWMLSRRNGSYLSVLLVEMGMLKLSRDIAEGYTQKVFSEEESRRLHNERRRKRKRTIEPLNTRSQEESCATGRAGIRSVRRY